ncbi:fatty acid--CoA ligase family protein [Streptomyces sp. MspMP-M5]|uniref:class I adenylate-forming enzyme family protein n=1 Tax=unclassified Streptomyces TaxID=2593676 RepID=UPI000563BD7F|nr:fatty acid--CoA ligase family protein [Streptomyces sp. MspMP-M5]MYT29665.1 AMP-binding protein [Streptomyces sp. SID8354]
MRAPIRDLVPAALRRSWAADGSCPDLDLYGLFRARRYADPHRGAVIDPQGEVSYAELDRRARCLAAGLAAAGVRSGDIVGVQLPSGRQAVIADLALAALGAVVLPFPVGRGRCEAASLLGRSGAVAVIAATEHGGNRHAEDLVALSAELPALPTVFAAGPGQPPPGAASFDALLEADGAAFTPARPDPDAAVRILVSSGSEAEPKMVAYSHNALAGGRGNVMASLLDRGQPPRNLYLVPLASAFGSSGTAVTLARHGGTLILLDRFDPGTALTAIARHRPTHLFAVPTMIRMLLERLGRTPTDTSSLTAMVLGGAPLDAGTAAEARRAFGCAVVNLYGSADGVNCHTGLAERTQPDDGPGIAAGHPDPRVADILIADLDAPPGEVAPAPPGVTGEIVARGPMTPLSYVGSPELDARYRTPGGWVRTGDLGILDESGSLRLMGRLKDIVIRGGVNISPNEVERHLLTHPQVREVVCVGLPDQLMGERLGACVVPKQSQEPPVRDPLSPEPSAPEPPSPELTLTELTLREPTLKELCHHLDARGLERRKHPEALLLLDELPLTPAGKPDRAALRERLAETGGAQAE